MRQFYRTMERFFIFWLFGRAFYHHAYLPNLPFCVASWGHRSYAIWRFNGKRLKGRYEEAFDNYGPGSAEAQAVEAEIDRLNLSLQYGRLVNDAQAAWIQTVKQHGLPENVIRCFNLNKNIDKFGRLVFNTWLEYSMAILYVITAVAATIFLIIHTIIIVAHWHLAGLWMQLLLFFLLPATIISIISLGYFTVLPSLHYRRYFVSADNNDYSSTQS